MFKIMKWFIPSLSIVAIAGLIVYNAFPQLILKAVLAQYEIQAGVSDQTIALGQYELPYYEGGAGETLILIHGFGDSKRSFLQMVKFVTPHYHVLLPEVPGFGDTARLPERNHSIRTQVNILHQFVLKKELRKFHLGGNSMGGHIAAAYTLAHPAYVDKLILLDAAGLIVDDPDPYKPSKAPLRNSEDFDASMDDLFVKKPFIPESFKLHFIEQSIKNFHWMNQIRQQIREGEDYLLNDRIQQILQPTLVLWGRQDKIVRFAVGEAYHKGIPNSKIHVFDPGGHSPQYEYPEKTAQVIMQFLEAYEK